MIVVSTFSFTLEVVDDIANAIRSGNPKNISAYFIDNIDKNNLTVNFTDQVSNGIYLLTVTTIDGGIVNEKIMVER